MQEKIKALIIDDEELARSIIKKYLMDFPDIELTGECSSGFEGIKKIHEDKPGIIFLDIQMPKINGFEMLELIEEPPVIVFTTAFDNYAVKAFEVNAVDYLLKPFSQERFSEALQKAIERFNETKSENQSIKKLINYNNDNTELLDRIVIKDGTKISILPIEKIKFFEAKDDYVLICTEIGNFLKPQTMKYFEDHLNPKDFIRVHRSYIVAISNIDKIESSLKDNYEVILRDKTKIPVSRTGYSKLKEYISL